MSGSRQAAKKNRASLGPERVITCNSL